MLGGASRWLDATRFPRSGDDTMTAVVTWLYSSLLNASPTASDLKEPNMLKTMTALSLGFRV